MIDESMFFKVNSETDEKKLIELNHIIVKRVSILRYRKQNSHIQKAEIVETEKEKNT